MSIVVSLAHGIRFYKDDSALPNFDNTPTSDEVWKNHFNYNDCQEYYATDVMTIQVKQTYLTAGAVPAAPTMNVVDFDGNATPVLGVQTPNSPYTSGDYTLKFYEFPFLMGAYSDKYTLRVTGPDETYKSNGIEIVEEDSNLLLLEWYNFENEFEMNYSSGIVHFLRCPALMRDYVPSGEISMYDNIGVKTKLKEIVGRGFNFEIQEIPRWYSEVLRIASSHDKFLINDVEFVREEVPDIEPMEKTNYSIYRMVVTQEEIAGLNTHDIGFNCDQCTEDMKLEVKDAEGATGSGSIEVSAGYMLSTLEAVWVSGSNVLVKIGTTPGGDDLVLGVRPASGDTNGVTSLINYACDTATTIYYTVTGVDQEVDLYFITLKNRQ
jgi:hypothetical protein